MMIPEQLQACAEALEELTSQRHLDLESAEIQQIVSSAFKLVQSVKKNRKKDRRQRDRDLLDSTGIRNEREVTSSPGHLSGPHKCHICLTPFKEVHFFYDRLCPECAELNYHKRNQQANMSERIALVTGGRVKTGFHIAVKLLRAGTRVMVTTRFPHDAAQRFATLPDFETWQSRLQIHGLDLRHLGALEQFIDRFQNLASHLDILINNAAQTVRRPPAFYQHLIEREITPELPGPESAHSLVLPQASSDLLPALMTQLAVLPEDKIDNPDLFPPGSFDVDGQQVDLRERNSWDLEPGEVSTWELVEVHAINCMAPFILITQLESHFLKSPHEDRYIINVSATEGQLNTKFKSGKHPHTNMAKAALNMITRTCAEQYAMKGIYMNSVDTGWHNNEAPHPKAEAMAELGFRAPLDAIDGAARVLDPIFNGERVYGKFLKDYREARW